MCFSNHKWTWYPAKDRNKLTFSYLPTLWKHLYLLWWKVKCSGIANKGFISVIPWRIFVPSVDILWLLQILWAQVGPPAQVRAPSCWFGYIIGWPKSSFGFSPNILEKIPKQTSWPTQAIPKLALLHSHLHIKGCGMEPHYGRRHATPPADWPLNKHSSTYSSRRLLSPLKQSPGEARSLLQTLLGNFPQSLNHILENVLRVVF